MKQPQFKYKKMPNPLRSDFECEEILGDKPSNVNHEYMMLLNNLFHRLYQCEKKGGHFDIDNYFAFHNVSSDMAGKLNQTLADIEPQHSPDAYRKHLKRISLAIEQLGSAKPKPKQKTLIELIPNYTQQKADYVMSYGYHSADKLAALIVALDISESMPTLVKAIKLQYDFPLTPFGLSKQIRLYRDATYKTDKTRYHLLKQIKSDVS